MGRSQERMADVLPCRERSRTLHPPLHQATSDTTPSQSKWKARTGTEYAQTWMMRPLGTESACVFWKSKGRIPDDCRHFLARRAGHLHAHHPDSHGGLGLDRPLTRIG